MKTEQELRIQREQLLKDKKHVHTLEQHFAWKAAWQELIHEEARLIKRQVNA